MRAQGGLRDDGLVPLARAFLGALETSFPGQMLAYFPRYKISSKVYRLKTGNSPRFYRVDRVPRLRMETW